MSAQTSRTKWIYLISMMALFIGTFTVRQASAQQYVGKGVPVGQGYARVVVATNEMNVPTAVAVVLDKAALDGLPEATASKMEFEYVLPMPSKAPATGYDHVALDWNPLGHSPKGIYTAPHFDVHYYLISSAEQNAISFKGENAAKGSAAPDARLVPSGYVIPPDTAVEAMGVHAVDTGSPEFHGKPFTHTFIYGYYRGHMNFVEAMVTKKFMESHSDVTASVKTPDSYSRTGYYPSRYRIGYDAKRGQYTVALGGLKPFERMDD